MLDTDHQPPPGRRKRRVTRGLIALVAVAALAVLTIGPAMALPIMNLDNGPDLPFVDTGVPPAGDDGGPAAPAVDEGGGTDVPPASGNDGASAPAVDRDGVLEAPVGDEGAEADPAAQTAEKTPVDLARETNAAVEAARAALAVSGCRDFVGPTIDGMTALQVLETLAAARGPRQIVDDGTTDQPGSTPGSKIYAQAEDENGRSGTGKGAAGTIRLFKAFHDELLPTTYYNAPTSPDNKMFELDRDQTRVLILLHELMHLMGTFQGEHTNTDALGNTTTNLPTINEIIIINCIPGARRVDRPAPPSGGGGATRPPGDGAVEAPSDFPSGPMPGDDLPESDDPVIDFGSDAPVIIGDDGSVIDGGDVGEAYDDPGYIDPGEDPAFDPGYGGGDYYDPDCCYGGGGGDGYYPELDDPFYYYEEMYAY